MKKYNPRKRIKKSNGISLESQINYAFIPLLVLGCCALAMVGIAFSYKLTQMDKKTFKVNISSINGTPVEINGEALEGSSYIDNLSGNGVLSYIDCQKGNVEYDPIAEKVTVPFVNSDIQCTLVFDEENSKKLAIEGMLEINDNDGVSYYYPGNATNNYIKVNNRMFRIVRVNGDGTLRIILNSSDYNFNYGSNNSFLSSNVRKTLNKWFNDNFKGKKYVVQKDFDVSSYYEIDKQNLVNLDSTYNGYVGTLSVREAALIVDSGNKNYLGNILLANNDGGNGIYAILNNQVTVVGLDKVYNVKPVINIKVDNLDGSGIEKDPYVIKED